MNCSATAWEVGFAESGRRFESADRITVENSLRTTNQDRWRNAVCGEHSRGTKKNSAIDYDNVR